MPKSEALWDGYHLNDVVLFMLLRIDLKLADSFLVTKYWLSVNIFMFDWQVLKLQVINFRCSSFYNQVHDCLGMHLSIVPKQGRTWVGRVGCKH